MESFYCKTKIYSGKGALQQLKHMGIRRLVLVADPYFVKNGTAEKIPLLCGAEASEIFHKVNISLKLWVKTIKWVKFTDDVMVKPNGSTALILPRR